MGTHEAHERDTANASGWESQGKNRVRVHPAAVRSGVRGPTDATGGSFFSVRGPERHIRASASWKVFCARPRPRSAFAARSRSTDWPDRNEPPHAPVSRSHVSRCPPNGIAMWDTKCMRGTRPMHPDGSRKGKIGSAFTPPPFGGPRSHGRNGGLVLLGQLSPHGLVARTGPIATSPPTPLYPAPTSHDAPLTESQYGTQSVREGHGQCIWMGIARENVTHIYPSRSGVRGPADATGGSFFSVRGPERHIRGSASWKVFCARPRPRSAFAARSRSTD
ncbi:hypothetical protein CRENBAI_021894 [Crenichthys baileyi]|uniref:Uncharacterized protein n=1 Tax=Crenichthys baileyi TaxID=28760 RepID=A0AAV9SRM4_9TELE